MGPHNSKPEAVLHVQERATATEGEWRVVRERSILELDAMRAASLFQCVAKRNSLPTAINQCVYGDEAGAALSC